MANFNTKHHENIEAKIKNYEKQYSLWENISSLPANIDSSYIDFLQTCMVENLNHSRHVENERLTFNTVFLALVAGVLTFASTDFINNIHPMLDFGLYLSITIAGFLSMLLTIRWNNAFKRHQYYAQKCYILIHNHYFNKIEQDIKTKNAMNSTELSDEDKKFKERIKGLYGMPAYSFGIHNPIPFTPLGDYLYKANTKLLYNIFYLTIQIVLVTCTVLSFKGII